MRLAVAAEATPSLTKETIGHNIIGPGSSWFWAMVQAIAVGVTLLLILRQVRLQRLANMLNALHGFDARWQSDLLLKARKSVCQTPFDSSVELNDGQDAVLVFFEDLGMQVKRGILDAGLVWDTYSPYIEFYWPILKGKVEEQWNQGDKTFYEDFKSLYAVMGKLSRRRGVRFEHTRAEVERFAQSEASREV